MKKIISKIILILCILCSTNIIFADNDVRSYKFDKDVNMSGVMSSYEKFFYVPKNIKVDDSKLNLVFTKSELLNIDYSTITIQINDTPIHSLKMGKEQEYKKRLTIDIPSDLINEGYNKVVIKTYKTLSDKICQDDANTANWMVVHKESNINLKYTKKESKNLLSNFENIFNSVNNSGKLNTTIVIPDNPKSSEVKAGLNVSLGFGKDIKNDEFDVNIKFESELTDKDLKSNIIYLSTLDNISNKMMKILSEEDKDKLSDSSVIKIDDSPFDKNKKLLMVLAKDEELLLKSVQLLISNDYISHLNKDSIYLNKDSDVLDIIDDVSNDVSLEDLGYDNVLLKGPFTQEVIFDIPFDNSKLSKDGSSINLDFRYAKSLDFNRSLVSVFVNDIPIGSKKLRIENADNDTLNIKLPKDLLNQSYYQIKIVFNLELLDLECVTRDVDNPWAYVLNSSNIDFKYEDNNSPNFKYYPNKFIKDKSINDLNIVIPKNVSSDELSDIGNMIAYMGKEVEYNNNLINVMYDDEFLDSKKESNNIIIGTPSTNKAIRDINDKLLIKYDENFVGFENNEQINFINESKYNSEVAIMQYINDLYSKDKSSLVISSTNINDLSLATSYLSDGEEMSKLDGDCIVIDRNKNIKNLNFDKESIVDEVKEDKNKFSIDKDNGVFILITSTILIILVISIILLLRKYKK